MAVPDVGNSAANALWQQATAGTFTLEQGAAKNCADIYNRFGDSLDQLIDQASDLRQLGGFGGFDSAQQLQQGFEGKAAELYNIIAQMKSAAYKMAAAYLQAGKCFDEVDQMNKKSILAAQQELPA